MLFTVQDSLDNELKAETDTIKMFTTHRNGWSRLPLVLLAAVLLMVASASVIRVRHRPTQVRSALFQVPLGDRTTGESTIGGPAVVPDGQLMTLDPTRKFLINSRTKKPVFITGDDAWSMHVQLSDSDIQFYLSDRAARGFNAIWVALVDNTYSNHPPKDCYGNVPFNGADFTNENPKYWARVGQTLSWAAAQGITVLASPAFVGYGCKGGYCQSYRNSSTDVLRAYGQFLGDRYKGYPNIIWLIGGDADPADSNVQSKLDALAKGIKSADTVHLMTTENYRGTSSNDVWAGARWLDLDALYLEPTAIPAKTQTDYLAGTYPVFMMEDWYEGEHSMTDLEVRMEGYWAVLSGSTLGRIFGNYAIWHFSWTQVMADPWKSQLNAPGSVGQEWLGKLFRSREHWKLIPDIDHAVMTAGYNPRPIWRSARATLRSFVYGLPIRPTSMLSVAARTSDGRTIIAYVPNGNATTITIDMSKVMDTTSRAICWWFNTRDGSSTLIGTFATSGTQKFTPPDANDWVLVVDSLSANLAAPGSKDL